MRAGREFAPQTGSPVTASSASESGLWGVISRWGENRRHSRRLGWGAPQSLVRNFWHFGSRGAGFWLRSLVAFFQFLFRWAETGSTVDRDRSRSSLLSPTMSRGCHLLSR